MASTSKPNDDASAMPPPPIPASTKPAVAKTLQPEFEALAQCLKVRITAEHILPSLTIFQDAILKTSQVYSFYSDAQKL